MSDAKPFLTLTSDAARFAVREYFRPIVTVYRFFRPLFPQAQSEDTSPEKKRSSEGKKIRRTADKKPIEPSA